LVVALRGAAGSENALSDEAPAPLSEQSYTGTDRCVQCHRDQVETWLKTGHAKAHTNLPARYQQDPACLKCHVTAYAQPGGYAPGSDKDLVEVGCESCHGPGALHENAALRYRFSTASEEEEKLEKEMKTTIVRMPADDACAACHVTQGHQPHPAYEGQPSAASDAAGTAGYHGIRSIGYHPAQETRSAYPFFRGYNIKTCGSCHYGQYRQWQSESHVDLAADLPARYLADQACLACHTQGVGVAKVFIPAAEKKPETVSDALGGYVDAACESCHGPGRQHVRFTVRYIGTSLGPEPEQSARQAIREGKPANACLECHTRHGHKEHPAYEGDGKKAPKTQ
ncbi:MAG: multiheme c-type cytochrome, partial [Thermoguttaceae bacterium]